MKKEPSTAKVAYTLAKKYFTESNERTSAWLLLLLALLGILATVAITGLLSWYSVGLWTALIAKDLPVFLNCLTWFSLSLAGLITGLMVKDISSSLLSIRWREWLTKDYVQRYLANKNYLKIQRTQEPPDNIAQRIQENVKSFVESSLSIFLDFTNSSLRIAFFSASLWIIGGALSVAILGASFTIPGYLFWCALLFAFVGNYITHKIGQGLGKIQNKETKLEADLRKEVDFVQQKSENIAITHSEAWHQKTIFEQTKEITQNRYEKLKKQGKINVFLNFYLNSVFIFPLIASAPLLFRDKISIAQLGQISTAFTEIQLGFSWFSTAYDNLTSYAASVGRLHDIDQAIRFVETDKAHQNIQNKKAAPQKPLEVKSLTTRSPSSHDIILDGLNMTLEPGKHTLIKGDSGLGKSTLFKVFSNTWQHGQGQVTRPAQRDAFFLSQEPLLPNSTLKAILAYPESIDTYSKETYIKVLRLVKLEKLITELDNQASWTQRLSGGEQQRLAFARAILKKPKWLFMDESTSALDESNERLMYQLIKRELPDTTIVSIAHKSSVEKYHDRIFTIRKDADGLARIQETCQASNDMTASQTNKSTKISA